MKPIAVLLITLAAAGCGRSAEQGASPATEAAATAPSKGGDAAGPVARIVFVGKAQACECTRERIDTSWASLQAALGGSGPAVERLRMDTEGEQVERYRALRPMITLPGIYLLDGQDNLVEMLQGEVTEAQLRAALGAGG